MPAAVWDVTVVRGAEEAQVVAGRTSAAPPMAAARIRNCRRDAGILFFLSFFLDAIGGTVVTHGTLSAMSSGMSPPIVSAMYCVPLCA